MKTVDDRKEPPGDEAALRMLVEAGIAHREVDRCPVPRCEVCDPVRAKAA